MDILHQLSLLSFRTNKFYKRTGRKFLGLHGKTKIGLDKSKLKCYKCHRLGHFSRECKGASNQLAPYVTFPTNQSQSSNSNFIHHTPQQATAHFVQAPNNQPIQFVQAPNNAYQLVPSGNQFQLIQAPVTPNTSTHVTPCLLHLFKSVFKQHLTPVLGPRKFFNFKSNLVVINIQN